MDDAHEQLNNAAWRTSTFSNAEGSCVQIAVLGDDTTAVRNSNHPDAGVVLFSNAQMATFIAAVKVGGLDDTADLA